MMLSIDVFVSRIGGALRDLEAAGDLCAEISTSFELIKGLDHPIKNAQTRYGIV